MAIIQYVPRNVEVLDRRTPEGGYYVAKCEECGREFYPKNKKAKFCSKECANHSYVKTTPTNNSNKKKIKDEVPGGKVVTGTKQIIEYIAEVNPDLIRGRICFYRTELKGMKEEDVLNIGNLKITKISTKKYNIKRRS